MKRIAAMALSFLMAATLFAGCRRNVGNETTAPTNATQPTTLPATQPVTQPATNHTTPSTGDGASDPSGDRLIPNMR